MLTVETLATVLVVLSISSIVVLFLRKRYQASLQKANSLCEHLSDSQNAIETDLDAEKALTADLKKALEKASTEGRENYEKWRSVELDRVSINTKLEGYATSANPA